MTEGVIGLGTLLKIGDGASPEVFAAIAEVKDITGPGLTREFPYKYFYPEGQGQTSTAARKARDTLRIY